jgi:3-isopropylmalate/(R)-2-methylmalate dehydratase small subunit
LRTLKGKAWKVGDNVDTDQIIAGRYLSLTDPHELGEHCFEASHPDVADLFQRGDVVVAGENFGCGSSREHAVIALKALGASCIIAKSFARIFCRNCINLGLSPLECPDFVDRADSGDEILVDLGTGQIQNVTKGETFGFEPFPPLIEEILAAGDLSTYVRSQLS